MSASELNLRRRRDIYLKMTVYMHCICNRATHNGGHIIGFE